MPTLAIAIFVAVFAIATFRDIHLGVLMLPAAVAVGVWLAGMPIRDILAGFPINILVLVGGVTYFFGIAQGNGTIDGVIQKLIAGAGDRRALLPYLIFLITAGVASMGSSQAGYVMIPLAMAAARRSAVDPMLMGIALNSGMRPAGSRRPVCSASSRLRRPARPASISIRLRCWPQRLFRTWHCYLSPHGCSRARASPPPLETPQSSRRQRVHVHDSPHIKS